MNKTNCGQGRHLSSDELMSNRKVLNDTYEFEKHIPEELKAEIDDELTYGAKQLVKQLLVLAIQYGRSIERLESSNNIKLKTIHTKGD